MYNVFPIVIGFSNPTRQVVNLLSWQRVNVQTIGSPLHN